MTRRAAALAARGLARSRTHAATLIADGRTVGRHYAGPNWEHVDGSAVTARTTVTHELKGSLS